MGSGFFLEVKYGWGVLVTTHPLLVPWSWKGRAIPLPTLWATTGPVTGTLYLLFVRPEIVSWRLDCEGLPVRLLLGGIPLKFLLLFSSPLPDEW